MTGQEQHNNSSEGEAMTIESGQSGPDEATERTRCEINLTNFRLWLQENIWSPDDMGGFVTGGTDAEVVANVADLFDLIDPDWRLYTAENPVALKCIVCGAGVLRQHAVAHVENHRASGWDGEWLPV